MGVAARALFRDALAASLAPARVAGAPGADVNVGGSATGVACCVDFVGKTEDNGKSEEENKDLLEHWSLVPFVCVYVCMYVYVCGSKSNKDVLFLYWKKKSLYILLLLFSFLILGKKW